MRGLRNWTRRASTLTVLTAVGALAFSGVAVADTLQDTIADIGTGVTLVAGSGSGSAAIRVVGNNAQGDPDAGCNIDAGEAPLKLDIITPTGITANPDPLSITSCGTDFPITLTASSNAVSGHVTVAVLSGPAGGGTYVNQVDIPVTVNSKPTVAVTGVTDGASYVVGSVPAAGCAVTDSEDGTSTKPAVLSGTLTGGLGTQTATCDYTDAGGLKADTKTATYTILAPPNTRPTVAVTGVTDGVTYEIGDVPAAGCEVTDPEDGNSHKSAVLTGTLSHGLGEQTATCDYTDGGGLEADTQSATFTIVDTGTPTIEHSLAPSSPNGSNGWYTTDVTVTFECHDLGSGVKSCVGGTTVGNGADQSVTGTATDWAGLVATDTVSGLNVDKTPPNAPTVSLDPVPNTDGWNNSDVVVSFKSAGDNGPSGVDHCTADVPVSTETGGQTVSGTCIDRAGNVSAKTVVTVKLDKTGPTVSDAVTVVGTKGNNGWYTSDVDVTFTATDDLSGLTTDSQKVSSFGEGDAVTVGSPGFTDRAGNTTGGGTVTKNFKIDKSDPTVDFSGGPAPGASYYFGNDPAAPTCAASDTVSGLESCVISGGGTSVGTHSYTATATDNAGRTSTATLGYTVLAWNTKGYYAPVDKGTVSSPVWNTVKGGSTVPLKFELFAGSTELTSTTAVKSFTQRTIACPNSTATVDEIELVTTGGTSLRYDSAGGQYVQNWQTPKKPGTCYQAVMTAQDGSTISASFMLK